MVDLVATSPLKGVAPKTVGSVTLKEVDLGHLTSIAPFKGANDALSVALNDAHGMTFPKPNRATGREDASAIWIGYDMALLVGPAPDSALAQHAALTDQSDAWTCLALEGDGAEDVLARLVPVDVRSGTFKLGHTMRSLVQHMNASVTRTGQDTFLVMVFRSMAKTLQHDLETAMESIASRS
ncbi:MAG: sarcosine oxidase subunit gamma family protein [Paracoccaceae bacterium]